MKLFTLYLFAIVLSVIPFISVANSIKQDLQNKTEKIDNVVSAYSQYLHNF